MSNPKHKETAIPVYICEPIKEMVFTVGPTKIHFRGAKFAAPIFISFVWEFKLIIF